MECSLNQCGINATVIQKAKPIYGYDYGSNKESSYYRFEIDANNSMEHTSEIKIFIIEEKLKFVNRPKFSLLNY